MAIQFRPILVAALLLGIGVPFAFAAGDREEKASGIAAAMETMRENESTNDSAEINQNMKEDELHGIAKAMKTMEPTSEEMKEKATREVQDAMAFLEKVMDEPDSVIRPATLRNAKGIVIIPDVVRVGAIFGGYHGDGILAVREENEWTFPALVSISGGSIGAQLGAEATDLIMVFQKQETVEKIFDERGMRLGMDASVAVGSADAAAGSRMKDADIIVYQRAKGLFAGVSLEGNVLQMENEALIAYYQLDVPPVRAYIADEGPNGLALRFGEPEEKDSNAPAIVIYSFPESARELKTTLDAYSAMRR